jgi:microsomal epoxide hydrolase
MIQLGFGGGYIAQGGDVGSELAKRMILQFDEVKAAHINMHYMFPPKGEVAPPTEDEMVQMQRSVKDFQGSGMGYAIIHATKPSTIGLAVSSNPISLLAWCVNSSLVFKAH